MGFYIENMVKRFVKRENTLKQPRRVFQLVKHKEINLQVYRNVLPSQRAIAVPADARKYGSRYA